MLSFKPELIWDDYPYPLIISKKEREFHRVIYFNKCFSQTFSNLEIIPEKSLLEDLFGPLFEEIGLSSFQFMANPFYLLTLPLPFPYKLHLFIEEKIWLQFPQWFHTERLASLGKLAGEISHELNNPLGGILLYADMLKEELPQNPRWHELLDKIINLARRCKVIARALLDFGRPERGKKEWVNLNEIILKIYDLIAAYQIFQKIKFIFNLDSNLPKYYANPTQMEQVFLNLFTNAAEAMKGEGTIIVETKARDDRIVIRVKDTGPGIPKEILPYIFDPFFTTKKTGKGIGLGLSICHSIIKRHGGQIKVDRPSEGGALFEITLPLATREALREDVF
ncbi:MAG: sensor histidine kinase [Caldimicrobium sp.]